MNNSTLLVFEIDSDLEQPPLAVHNAWFNFKIVKQVKNGLAVLILLLCFAGKVAGQADKAVSEIITDYEGYWRSSAGALNTVKPSNSHNLLAFTFKGATYSTGVNNKTLSLRGISYTPLVFVALPVQSVPGTVTSNTKIGLGAMYDGVAVGPGNPPPSNNIPYYLTDGLNGLDLGTCIANLPAGTISFAIINLSKEAIGDGVPDILVTQVADPSTSYDRYSFTDVNGVQVGNYLDIKFTDISPVGQWMADFYEANTNPMTLGSTFTNSQRDLRLWAADFTEFGINTTNIDNIKNFQIKLSGTSDVAFVSHNNYSFNSADPLPGPILPVSLTYFSGKDQNGQTLLTWQTDTEKNNSYFAVENSTDGKNFKELATLPGAGNSTAKVNYTYTHTRSAADGNYYRLKQVDFNGEHTMSKIVLVKNRLVPATFMLYPNPAHEVITMAHETATGQEQVQVLNLMGQSLLQMPLAAGTNQTNLKIQQLPKGYYQVVYSNAQGEKAVQKLLVE